MPIAPLPKPPKKLTGAYAAPKYAPKPSVPVNRHGIPTSVAKPKLKGSINLKDRGFADIANKAATGAATGAFGSGLGTKPGSGNGTDRSTASFSAPGSSDATVPPEPEAPAAFGAADLIAKLKMFDADPQLYKDLYGAVSKSILGARDTQAADIETQRAATKKIYDDSTAMVAQKLAEDKAALGAAGEGLGVNLNASVLSKDWDQNSLNQKISQEAYRGADEVYWNKAKQSGQDLFSMLNNSALLSGTNHEADLKRLVDATNAGITSDANSQFSQYELARLAAEALAAQGGSGGGGGGGGRRRGGGGGGGSSGSVYDTLAAGETSTLNNVGDEAIYEALRQSNPAAAAEYLRMNNLSTGSPLLQSAQKALDEDNASYTTAYQKLRTPKGGPLQQLINFGRYGGQAGKALTNANVHKAVLGAASVGGGIMGNPKTTATVSTKANQRVYQPGVPYKTTVAPAKAPAKKAPAKAPAKKPAPAKGLGRLGKK